jgi:hypothetical protein
VDDRVAVITLNRPDKLNALSRPLWQQLDAAWSSGKVIVAAVHGDCLGRGLELALWSDIVVASQDTRLGHPEIREGALLYSVIPWLTGPQQAKLLMLSGDVINAREAARTQQAAGIAVSAMLSGMTPLEKGTEDIDRIRRQKGIKLERFGQAMSPEERRPPQACGTGGTGGGLAGSRGPGAARARSSAAIRRRLFAKTAAPTKTSNRSRPASRQRRLPRPRRSTEMRPSMPARKRCPCLNARVLSYAVRSAVLCPPRCGTHSVPTPALVNASPVAGVEKPRSAA